MTDDSLKQWKYYTISLSKRNYVLLWLSASKSREKYLSDWFFFNPMRCKPISRERFCEASCIYPRLQELEMKLHYSSVCISLVLPTCCLKSSRVITKEAN